MEVSEDKHTKFGGGGGGGGGGGEERTQHNGTDDDDDADSTHTAARRKDDQQQQKEGITVQFFIHPLPLPSPDSSVRPRRVHFARPPSPAVRPSPTHFVLFAAAARVGCWLLCD
ncbi:hypothetical protein niasHS_010443 [Heterodera schachtii]|uniref:Uncharacterized protein n=2 Tax=Heterodera TaxID=34509 RepID=A0ABD2IZU1_HETSC